MNELVYFVSLSAVELTRRCVHGGGHADQEGEASHVGVHVGERNPREGHSPGIHSALLQVSRIVHPGQAVSE
jgi:hypothetical protein